jgi:hypothetical protein
MKQTATTPKSKQLFIKKNIVVKFSSTLKNMRLDNFGINDTLTTTISSIIKTAWTKMHIKCFIVQERVLKLRLFWETFLDVPMLSDAIIQ